MDFRLKYNTLGKRGKYLCLTLSEAECKAKQGFQIPDESGGLQDIKNSKEGYC